MSLPAVSSCMSPEAAAELAAVVVEAVLPPVEPQPARAMMPAKAPAVPRNSRLFMFFIVCPLSSRPLAR